MQTIRVRTTQNVFIHYPLANVGDRLVAYIIDQAILWICSIAIFAFLVWLEIQQWWIYLIFLGFPMLFYSLAFEILMNGQSPGKMVMKIKVVRLNGTPPAVGDYLLRWIFRFVDFGISSGAVAMITISVSKNAQRVGDMVAGTAVIKVVGQEEIHSAEVFIVPDEEYTPLFPEVVNLTSRDIELVQQALEVNRNRGNGQPAFIASEKIQSVLGIRTDLPPVKFLYTIVKDYNHLTAQPV